jgi:hypothetical protein
VAAERLRARSLRSSLNCTAAPLAKAFPIVNGAHRRVPAGASVVMFARTPFAEREALLSRAQAAAAPGTRASATSRAPRMLVAVIKQRGRFIISLRLITA